MRILQLCPTMHEAGTWFRCFCLSKALVKRGHQVTLVKVSPDSRLKTRHSQRDGVDIVETPRFFGSSWSHGNTRLVSDLLSRSALAAVERFDVVHTYSHHFNAVLPGLVAKAAHPGTALVMDWDDLWTDGGLYSAPEHGLVPRLDYRIDALSERHLKRLADAVTVVSHDLLERSVAHGVPREKITLLPNGAPVDDIRPGDRSDARAELGLPQDIPVAVFVGFGQYDLDMVFGAVQRVRQRGQRCFVAITGPHADKVLALAHGLGVTEDLRVAGLVPYAQMITYLNAADVGLMPYADKPINRARWPIKLGDYLAAGLPVVTCQVGEMGRMVTEHQVGTATAPNADAFAQGLLELLRTPDALVLGRRARSVAERHSWQNVAKQAEELYLAVSRPG